jgi:tripeptide aminopeptidase
MINQKRLISTFLELTQIDSPSGNEKDIAQFVAKKLDELGGKSEFDTYGNLIAKFGNSGTPFLLNSHLDTVEPGRSVKPIVHPEKITSDGTTILGGDAKSGVAIILETLSSLAEDKKPHIPLEVVFTIGEETGLLGAKNLDYSKIKSKIGITFDAPRSPAHIITAAPGYSEIDVKVTGRSAHAGFEPEKGISAIKIASEIITQLELGRIDDETTANIGLIEGGTARNAIPETVHFKAEIRSRILQKLEKHTLHFQKVFSSVLSKYKEITIDSNIKTIFDPYALDKSHRIVEAATNALKKIGLKPELVPSGGGADVNIFHKKGIEAVCIGSGYYNPHTTREYVKISDMIDGVKFCEEIVKN